MERSGINNSGEIRLVGSSQLVQTHTGTSLNTGSGNLFVDQTASTSSIYQSGYWSSPVSGNGISYSISSVLKDGSVPTAAISTPGEAANINFISGFDGDASASPIEISTRWLAKLIDASDWTRFIGSGATLNIAEGWNMKSVGSTFTFKGIPNDGDYTIAISKDNFSLVGNPYPSALDAEAFLVANTNIEGAIHIWTHGTQISESESDPFYNEFTLNYNVNDYITYNKIGSNLYTQGFNGKIASGQGFFVLMEHSGTSSTESVNFNNSMRDKSYDNNDFFRSTTDSNQTEEEERHRIWLNLISPTEQVSNILIGYMEGATLEKDRLYDAYGTEDNSLNLYSSINEERMVIQGRPLPFDSEDQVKLGAFIPNDGNYIIAIAGVDGLFFNESHGIFLEDLELNIIHDLRNQPYSFNAESGNISDRFILRYTNNSLSTEEHSAIDNLNIKQSCYNLILTFYHDFTAFLGEGSQKRWILGDFGVKIRVFGYPTLKNSGKSWENVEITLIT